MRAELEEAVRLLQQNQPEALEQALELLQETVFSFSMKVCGHREDAEDTMQEVLFKSVAHLAKFTSPKALAVWLYKVAKNRCLMSRRRSKFAPRAELSLEALMPDRRELEQLGSSPAKSPESAALSQERARQLRRAVAELGPDYRIILVLRDMEGLNDDEIAEITGLRPGTVRVRLHRARLFVRKRLARAGAFGGAGKPGVAGGPAPPRARRCREMFAALSDFLDERLDDNMCQELEKHMGECQPCEAFLETLEQTVQRCRALPASSPNARSAAELRASVLSRYAQAFSAGSQKN
jgi:RNA polymerase sigma-70 factor, ECF subfamily